MTNPFTAVAMPKGNTTLYAKWTPDAVSYIVEHYQQALDGQYLLTETDKTRTGMVGALTTAFAKSYTGFTAQPIRQQTIAPDGSTRVEIYYDRNLYDLTFVYGNGSNDITVKVPYGAAIVKPLNPTKEGYTFEGWDKSIPDTMPANSLTFSAKWAANTNTPYTVKHYKENLDGTYTLDLTENKTGATGQETSAAARTYTGFTAQKFSQKPVAADGNTIVGIYYNRNINSLTWEVNGGNPLTGSYTVGDVKYGTPLEMPEMPTRTGYTFDGWYKDEELTIPLDDNATMPDAPLALHAKWTVNRYTITFNSNGGSEVTSITQDYGTDVTELAAPARTGYNFAGWLLNGEKYSFTTMPAENITLVAEWIPLSDVPYKVEHYIENPDGSYPSEPYETENLQSSTGTFVTAAPKSYEGFTFNPDVSGTVSSGTVNEEGTLVLRLYYTRNSYNITWDGNGVDVSTDGATTGNVKYGAPIYKPAAAPVRTGYTFAGWYQDSALAIPLEDNATMPDAELTIYAKWTPNTYTVEFDPNGGSGQIYSQDFVYDVSQALAVNKYTKTGYIFNGWNTEPDGTGTKYEDLAPVINLTAEANGTVILYAQWLEDTGIKYNIWIAGRQVTSVNAGNVLGDGTVSYNVYTNTLTLEGINLSYGSSDPKVSGSGHTGAIYSSGNLNIELADNTENTIINELSTDSWNCGIYVSGNLVITGTGALTVVGGNGYTSHGISVTGKLTINGGNIEAVGREAEGVSGIYAGSGITINSGTVTATAAEATGGFSRGLESYTVLINGGTVIAAGEDYAIDGYLTYGAGLKIEASTDISGTPVDEYDPLKIDNYRYISIKPET